MTRPLTKEELVRSAWLTELRRQGHRQCHCVGTGTINGEKPVCALQLLAEVSGIELPVKAWADIGKTAGLSYTQTSAVIRMNDQYKWSFKQIADILEQGWYGNQSRD